jgi:predicted nucleic acid-binding protein
MHYVIDASTALGFVFDDEDDDRGVRLLASLAQDTLSVPGIWYAEVVNGLIQAQRRKRIDGAAVDRAIAHFGSLDIRPDAGEPDMLAIRRVADAHRLTAYDAAYLELALRAQLPLATNDSALAKAAKARGVKTL